MASNKLFCKVINSRGQEKNKRREFVLVSWQWHWVGTPVLPCSCGQRSGCLLSTLPRLGCFSLQVGRRDDFRFLFLTWMEALRMTSSHYNSEELCWWEQGCYSLVIVHFHISFIIEGREDHFLPIIGSGYIRSPGAYQRPRIVAT